MRPGSIAARDEGRRHGLRAREETDAVRGAVPADPRGARALAARPRRGEARHRDAPGGASSAARAVGRNRSRTREHLAAVRLPGYFDAAHLVLVDNRTHGGRVGYEVYVPLAARDEADGRADRPRLDRCPADARGTAAGHGAHGARDAHRARRIALRPTSRCSARTSKRAGRCGCSGWTPTGSRRRSDGRSRPGRSWPTPAKRASCSTCSIPVRMPSTTHTGYAVQWFGLATVLFAGWVIVGVGAARRERRGRGRRGRTSMNDADSGAASARRRDGASGCQSQQSPATRNRNRAILVGIIVLAMMPLWAAVALLRQPRIRRRRADQPRRADRAAGGSLRARPRRRRRAADGRGRRWRPCSTCRRMCDGSCVERIHLLRQMHVLLGRDADRVLRPRGLRRDTGRGARASSPRRSRSSPS